MQWRSHLMGVPMSGKVGAFYDEWAFPFNGRSEKSGIDEWKGRCDLPPSGGKLHLPHFTMNGRSHLTGDPKNRASMSGRVGAICRPPAANCTFLALREMGVPESSGIETKRN